MKHALTPFYRPHHTRRNKRVYVSGPMTGYESLNAPAFAEASETLREMGYSVCNPVETSDWLGHDLSHEEFLRFDFERVLEADFLVALPGWEGSVGSQAELLVATRIGIKCWRWDTFENYDRISYEDVAQAISSLTERGRFEPANYKVPVSRDQYPWNID